MCEEFTLVREQIYSEALISVQQAMLPAQFNIERGMRHTALLDLAKPYEKVSRDKVLHAAAKAMHENEMRMIHARQGLLRVTTEWY